MASGAQAPLPPKTPHHKQKERDKDMSTPIDMTDTYDFNSWNLRKDKFSERQGPRVGDFVLMPGEEAPRRFTHAWHDGLQTTVGASNGSGFYMGKDGFASFSGGLDPTLPFGALHDTGEVKEGRFWFFHHETWRANNGVDCEIPCRVYRYVPESANV